MSRQIPVLIPAICAVFNPVSEEVIMGIARQCFCLASSIASHTSMHNESNTNIFQPHLTYWMELHCISDLSNYKVCCWKALRDNGSIAGLVYHKCWYFIRLWKFAVKSLCFHWKLVHFKSNSFSFGANKAPTKCFDIHFASISRVLGVGRRQWLLQKKSWWVFTCTWWHVEAPPRAISRHQLHHLADIKA